MVRNTLSALATVFFTLSSTAGMAISAHAAVGASLQCHGTWDIVIGGLSNNDSEGFVNADQRVGYNSFDLRSGVNELNHLVRAHARACPQDFIHPVGYSGGAAVVHLWATENGKDFPGRASIVLIGDPKRLADTGGRGSAAADLGWVPALGGANRDYGGLPALQVCNGGDHICNSEVGWDGYLHGVHADYDFNVNSYPNNAEGEIYQD